MKRLELFECYKKIGLIADSHGNLKSIETGIAALKEFRFHALVHLGDIFDSLENDDLYKIYQTITYHNFLTVKGNNDFQVEKRLHNGHSFDISCINKDEIISFLKHMPMRLVDETICFTHSLPYNSIRSFYEPVDTGTTDRAIEIFAETTYTVIFCGHSHSSVLFRYRKGQVTREPIHPDEVIEFKASERYIVIVGSSDSGECGIWDKDMMTYQRISIHL